MKIITMLEAIVKRENWDVLKDEYSKIKIEDGVSPIQSYLVQDVAREDVWRLVSVWEEKSFERMKKLGETPRGVLVFKSAGAEPELQVFSVRKEISRK